MSNKSMVVWGEGLFIKPQHFQQIFRNTEYQLNQRIWTARRHAYGFSKLTINQEDLGFGKITLSAAIGVFADGSVIDIPKETQAPATLSIEDGEAQQIVYLAVPWDTDNIVNVTEKMGDDSGARYLLSSVEVKDISDQSGDFTEIKIGTLRTKLMLEKEDRSSFNCLAICKIREKLSDGTVLLDDSFIPPVCDAKASPVLTKYLSEIHNRLQKRCGLIAERMGQPSQGGVAEVSDFLMLQVMNRYTAWLSYVTRVRAPHPEDIFSMLVQAVGELSTFSDKRLCPDIKAYNHDDPSDCFSALVTYLNQLLSTERSTGIESLPIHEGRFGLRSVPVNDSSLYTGADFILAVKSSIPLEDLRKKVLQKIKISSIDNIAQLVKLAMPGISLIQLPVAPRQLPFHAGFSYFQLEDNAAYRAVMAASAGFGMHISGDFPDLEMEFWAIRR